MSTHRTEINIDVEVEYDYTPPSRGARDSLGGKRGAGPPLEPDEPAEVEITAVWAGQPDVKQNILKALPDEVVDSLQQEILDNLADELIDP